MHCADVPAVVPTVGLGSLKDPLRMNIRVCVCVRVCVTRVGTYLRAYNTVWARVCVMFSTLVGWAVAIMIPCWLGDESQSWELWVGPCLKRTASRWAANPASSAGKRESFLSGRWSPRSRVRNTSPDCRKAKQRCGCHGWVCWGSPCPPHAQHRSQLDQIKWLWECQEVGYQKA